MFSFNQPSFAGFFFLSFLSFPSCCSPLATGSAAACACGTSTGFVG
jgi:hypothetical protein